MNIGGMLLCYVVLYLLVGAVVLQVELSVGWKDLTRWTVIMWTASVSIHVMNIHIHTHG